MNLSFKNILTFSLGILIALSLVLSSLSSQVQAKQQNNDEAKANELAEEINFAMNDATTHDKNGIVTKVNTKKIKQRYGYVPEEYQKMQKDVKNGKQVENNFSTRSYNGNKTSQQCFNEKMNGYMKDFVPLAAISSMYKNPSPKNIKKFSVQAIKNGFKGNAATVAAVITYNYNYCTTHYPTPGANTA